MSKHFKVWQDVWVRFEWRGKIASAEYDRSDRVWNYEVELYEPQVMDCTEDELELCEDRFIITETLVWKN